MEARASQTNTSDVPGPLDFRTEQLAQTAKASDLESGEPEVAPERAFMLERSGETVAVERTARSGAS